MKELPVLWPLLGKVLGREQNGGIKGELEELAHPSPSLLKALAGLPSVFTPVPQEASLVSTARTPDPKAESSPSCWRNPEKKIKDPKVEEVLVADLTLPKSPMPRSAGG